MFSHTLVLSKFSDCQIKLTVLPKNAKILSKKQCMRFFFLCVFYTFNYLIPILCKKQNKTKKPTTNTQTNFLV